MSLSLSPDFHRLGSTLLIVVALFLLLASGASAAVGGEAATRFDFGTLTLGSLKLLGDAHLRNGSILLTRDLPVPNSGAGRALYAHPVRFRHPLTRAPYSFSTFFSFSVVNLNPSSIGGGLAFLLASDAHSLGDAGGFLGLINGTTDLASDEGAIVLAVEFDTLMDVEFSDINGNHVGVDLNSMVSTQVADLDAAGVDLKSGDLVNAWVEYDGAGQVFQVFVSYSTVRPGDPVLSFPIDIGRFVEDYMYVGFSGSTQGSTEIHSIEWWSFASAGGESSSPSSPSLTPSPPPPASTAATNSSSSSPAATGTLGPALGPSMSQSVAESPKNGSGLDKSSSPSSCQSNGLCRQGPAAVAGVATAGAFFLVAFAGILVWGFARRRRSMKKSDEPLTVDIVQTPREFSYRLLSAATRGFDPSRIIGHGAFGTVYKGIVPDTGALIAVKRCINDGGQGKAEFLSELSIIASLRHRNLVPLRGWCHEKGEILIVYDYMPNGSLDKALFEQQGAAVLTWRQRKRVLAGVASALAYLHRECERQVIHRDVKSSNVMLDEGFHARLGDFGLARQVEHDKSPDATVTAGTMGYLAPEYLLTGRATDKTDVFSFGAVVLEVVCGRRPIESTSSVVVVAAGSSSRGGSNLVEWVWRLHGEGKLLEAVDGRMRGEYEEGEMRRAMLVGLACSHPDPAVRPGMRTVVQMLSGEADPPFVPERRPSMSFGTTHHLLMSLQDSVSDWNGMAVPLSSFSSSSSSVNGGRTGGE